MSFFRHTSTSSRRRPVVRRASSWRWRSPAGTTRPRRAGTIVEWLKEDFDLRPGHAMALVHPIKNSPQISGQHVGTDGVHRDESNMLHIDGIAARGATAQDG